jgi:hypothetical protein
MCEDISFAISSVTPTLRFAASFSPVTNASYVALSAVDHE